MRKVSMYNAARTLTHMKRSRARDVQDTSQEGKKPWEGM